MFKPGDLVRMNRSYLSVVYDSDLERIELMYNTILEIVSEHYGDPLYYQVNLIYSAYPPWQKLIDNAPSKNFTIECPALELEPLC